MINVHNADMLEHQELKNLLTNFRRQQVSRFPIDAHCERSRILFCDSRFPAKNGLLSLNRSNSLALLQINRDNVKNTDVFTVQSRLIRNKKFSPENQGHYMVESRDVSKIAKAMRDYIKPYSAIEVADKTSNRVRSYAHEWIAQSISEFQSSFSLNRTELAIFAMRLQELGIDPLTPYMRNVVENGLPKYKEMVERNDTKYTYTHVYINPDETIQTAETDEEMKKYNNFITYTSLEDTPTDIQQQLAMLRIAEFNRFIPRVGIQISDTEYWVLTPRK